MATRRQARSKRPRTPPRRAPARPKLIVPEPLRDALPLTETLSYVLIKAPVTIVQDSARVQSKRKPRSLLTDEEWAKHLRLHPLTKRNPKTGQLLRARARLCSRKTRTSASNTGPCVTVSSSLAASPLPLLRHPGPLTSS
jgi:hypothetical protein